MRWRSGASRSDFDGKLTGTPLQKTRRARKVDVEEKPEKNSELSVQTRSLMCVNNDEIRSPRTVTVIFLALSIPNLVLLRKSPTNR